MSEYSEFPTETRFTVHRAYIDTLPKGLGKASLKPTVTETEDFQNIEALLLLSEQKTYSSTNPAKNSNK